MQLNVNVDKIKENVQNNKNHKKKLLVCLLKVCKGTSRSIMIHKYGINNNIFGKTDLWPKIKTKQPYLYHGRLEKNPADKTGENRIKTRC